MRDPMSALEQIIADAQQEGKFEDLEGEGKPLVIDTSPDAVIKGILKEANVSMAPEWITLACEIDRLLEQEEQLLQSYAAAAEAEQAALMGAGAPAAPVTTPGPPATSEPRRRGWRALVAPLAGQRSDPPARRSPDEPIVGAFQRRWDLTLERYAALLHDLNRKIRRFNQIVPLAHRQRALLPVQERLEAFAGRFPRPARAEDGTLRLERGFIPAALLSPPPEPEDVAKPKRDVLRAAALQRMRQGDRKPPPIG